MNVFYVGAGGALGSVGRYLVSGLVHRWLPFSSFPWGTLTVNVFGCFVIGLLGGLVELRGFFSPDARSFLLIGVLGGFTTFSTFGHETFGFLRDGETLHAFGNIMMQLTLGLLAVWLGLALATTLSR